MLISDLVLHLIPGYLNTWIPECIPCALALTLATNSCALELLRGRFCRPSNTSIRSM